MKKFVLSVITLIACSSFAFAQSGFAGPSISGLNLPAGQSGFGITLFSLGGQVGIYNLAGPLGLRATADIVVSPISGIFFLTGDALLSSGGSTNIYGGAGFGIFAASGATAPIVKGFVGGEFSVSEDIGIFVEAAPTYALQTSNFFIGGRAGLNFSFGDF